MGDQITFDYSATADGIKFEGSDGKGVQIELGKDLFLKGFDQQLVGVKKGDTKVVDAVLPAGKTASTTFVSPFLTPTNC